jgi:hypothetical protein
MGPRSDHAAPAAQAGSSVPVTATQRRRHSFSTRAASRTARCVNISGNLGSIGGGGCMREHKHDSRAREESVKGRNKTRR